MSHVSKLLIRSRFSSSVTTSPSSACAKKTFDSLFVFDCDGSCHWLFFGGSMILLVAGNLLSQ